MAAASDPLRPPRSRLELGVDARQLLDAQALLGVGGRVRASRLFETAPRALRLVAFLAQWAASFRSWANSRTGAGWVRDSRRGPIRSNRRRFGTRVHCGLRSRIETRSPVSDRSHDAVLGAGPCPKVELDLASDPRLFLPRLCWGRGGPRKRGGVSRSSVGRRERKKRGGAWPVVPS